MQNKNTNNTIGIFDSGVGGLSVVFEMQKISPSTNIVYIADTLYQPYGEKTEAEVIDRSRAIIEKFISLKINKIIIACSTATAVALKILKSEYKNVSIQGIITDSFVSHTLEKSSTGNIGIIATPLTTKSKTFEKALTSAEKDYQVFTKATPAIVNMISAGIPDKDKLTEQIKNDVASLIEKDIDTLILGCTHFSLIKEIIEDIFPKIHIISPPHFTAAEISAKHKSSDKKGKIVFYSTYLPKEFIDTTKNVAEKEIDVKHIKILFNNKSILTK